MPPLADISEVIGFFSYSRLDDEDSDQQLSALRTAIQKELRAQLGRTRNDFRIWQDTAAISHGKNWECEIKSAIDQAHFFIPIITPTAIKSDYCVYEFEQFLAREKALERNDLVFPILYIQVPELQDQFKRDQNVALKTVYHRQWEDWTPLRHENLNSPQARKRIQGFCSSILACLSSMGSIDSGRAIAPANEGGKRSVQEIGAERRIESGYFKVGDKPAHAASGESAENAEITASRVLIPRPSKRLKVTALALVVSLLASATVVSWFRYHRNLELAAIDAEIKTMANQSKPAQGRAARNNYVADRDYAKILPLLHRVQQTLGGYSDQQSSSRIASVFAFHIPAQSVTSYKTALEQLFRPRLLYRLEEVLTAKSSDIPHAYRALKAYLMLGGVHPVDREMILSWHQQDWEILHPGRAQASGRESLKDHLAALLDFDDGLPKAVELNQSVIEASRSMFAKLDLSQLAFALMEYEAKALNLPDWNAARAGGPDSELVFGVIDGAALETVRVSGFFTNVGFQRAFLDRLPGITRQLENDRWVFGLYVDQIANVELLRNLPMNVFNRYAEAYVVAWRSALGKMQIKTLTADKPLYLALKVAASRNSPIKSLFASVSDETSFSAARLSAIDDKTSAERLGRNSASGISAATLFLMNGDLIRGSSISSQFQTFHFWVAALGGASPIDAFVAQLNDILGSLLTVARVQGQTAQVKDTLTSQLQRLRAFALQFPDPFKDQMIRATDDIQIEIGGP